MPVAEDRVTPSSIVDISGSTSEDNSSLFRFLNPYVEEDRRLSTDRLESNVGAKYEMDDMLTDRPTSGRHDRVDQYMQRLWIIY